MNTKQDKLSVLRSQLLANGYSPIPNKDKACYVENWPRMPIDEGAIKRWDRMHGTTATGIRVEGGLCIIDIDINHRIIDDICDVMLATLPEGVEPQRLERSGKGRKVAWYCQTDDLFSRLHTRRWAAPDDEPDDDPHCIEIFGGGSPRQFGSFGPHSFSDDGSVKVEYKWIEESPADVPLHELDILTKDQLFKMLDAAEAELKVQGFEPVARSTSGEGVPGRTYDLTEDMLFDLAEGITVTLAELTEKVKGGYTGRCSAAWLEGPKSGNRQRCLISKTGAGHLAIWESSQGMTHLLASLKPSDYSAQVDRLAEKLRERQDKRRSKLNEQDDHISGAAKLLTSYAFMPLALKTPVVPLWSRTHEDAVSLSNFRTLNMPYCGEEVGARGGVKKINPVDVWLGNPQRIEAKGMRMRPDRECPVFEEHGENWVNTYRAPNLGVTDGGSADIGITFMEQLVPDKRERTWFMQWLAFKWQYPHVPGPSIVMVARDFGTGRGTFGALLKLLFGDQYVVNVGFKIFAGLNTQSQYTDWGLDALFAIVNESSASGDQSSYKSKHDVYEHIKEVVEPRATERTYVRKGERHVRAIASTTNVIMTNNLDAIPIPADDRRLAVLSNGSARDPEFWQETNDWMSKQVNIAAFAVYLEGVDIAEYDPYAPPIHTFAKEEMADFNRTPLDNILTDALNSMEEFFVPEQVLRRMAEIEQKTRAKLPDHWQGIATKEMRRHTYVVRYSNGQRIRPQIGGNRYEVMHMDKAAAENYENSTDLRRLLSVNGSVFGDEKTVSSVSSKIQSHLKIVKPDGA